MTDDKTLALYKSREEHLLKKLMKIEDIMKEWKGDRIGKDYDTLLKIEKVVGK